MDKKCFDELKILNANQAIATSNLVAVENRIKSSYIPASYFYHQHHRHHRKQSDGVTANAAVAEAEAEVVAVVLSVAKQIDLDKPSTSRICSMSSILRGDFDLNSQHDFAEVIDDETTTSVVVEAFEITSSNSLPTCGTTNASSSESVAVQDDSSSTDTMQMIKATANDSVAGVVNSRCISKYFNYSKVYVINDEEVVEEEENDDDDDDDEDDEDELLDVSDIGDLGEMSEIADIRGIQHDDENDDLDDDDDDEEELEDNDDDDDDADDDDDDDDDDDGIDEDDDEEEELLDEEMEEEEEEEEEEENEGNLQHDLPNDGQLTSSKSGPISIGTESAAGVIMSTNGNVIYLETPIMEEQQHQHHGQMTAASSAISIDINEQNLQPKRLKDEFLKAADAETADPTSSSSSTSSSHSVKTENLFNDDGNDVVECRRVASETHKTNASQAHERMSSRLQNMNLNNCIISQDIPSSSSQLLSSCVRDIESIDLIERRDFESEQHLTGGIILKSSSLIRNNLIDLGVVKSSLDESHRKLLSICNADEWPSSSNNASNCRNHSSENKVCTTPTSSRKFNGRLTKSTAKINLSTTLSHVDLQQEQLEQQRTAQCSDVFKCNELPATSCLTNSNSNSNSNSTSVIVEVPPTTSAVSIIATDSSNSNSNDSYLGGASSTASCNSTSSVVVTLASSATATSKISNSSKDSLQERKQPPALKSTSVLVHVLNAEYNHLHGTLQSTVANQPEYAGSHVSAVEMQDFDGQPSTSSARCQYAPIQRNQRQVHASAQTTERYLPSRSNALGSSNASASSATAIGVNLSLINRHRNRRLDVLTQQHNFRNHSQNIMENFREANHSQMDNHMECNESSAWIDGEENQSDIEEVCTCHHSSNESNHSDSLDSLADTDDFEAMNQSIKEGTGGGGGGGGGGGDLPNYIMHNLSISEEARVSPEHSSTRKRKYNDSRLMDHDYNTIDSPGTGATDYSAMESNSRKRIAYDFSCSPRSSQNHPSTSTANCLGHLSVVSSGSPVGRRTPRSLIPTRDHPPPELHQWIYQFQSWSHAERLVAVDRLIEHCEPTQVRHMMKVIEPQLQRDFISLLPRELALQVLSYLEPSDLLKAAQTCRSWRFLCDDNLLWKEKCRKSQILTETRADRPKRGRAGNMPPIASPWKAAYMRQHIIEMNWRSRPIREPKILKGHDEHVITCLQFSGNRIVSGSDDNTLKVWSAVTGRCLRTLMGHTGGVWSSQMAGNIIISGSTDRTLKVWDMETGQCVHTLLGHTSTVRCMHLHGNRVVSGSRDATLRVWDIGHGTCLRVLVGHLAAVRCVQYDGKIIVSGAYDYMVKIWHPDRNECLHTLQGHTNRVYSLQFDGVHVVSGSLDTSIRVWDVETGNCKHTLMGHQSLTSGMELRKNILVSGNADSTVKVWDITTGQCLQTLSGPHKHQSAVTCLQFNSRFVVTSSDDGTVKLWDVKTGEFIRNLVTLDSGGSGGVVWRIRANDTKLICAVGSRNGTEETKLMVLDFDVEGACVKCS